MKIVNLTPIAALLLSSTASATTVGDGVPLIYAPTPYPSSIYNGTQYNATVINGVPYNASNEWPCLTEMGYESIIPTCSLNCISYSLAQDDCDVDDFVCHCTKVGSAKIDAHVVPCLTSGVNATCSGEEIGELANFVHGALCPYFIEVGYEAYAQCGPGWGPPPSSSGAPTTTWGPKPTGNGTWGTWTSTSTSTKTWSNATASATGPAYYTNAAVANKVAGAVVAGGVAAAALFL